ncbi:hypothetical protein A2W67_00345 [Candidatus Nomurabacteria bacterium RIFCSPLOWO2_02_40_28]|uniref:Uncharacterized protein n=1 Tax=Candidatus Nomurabacteria bacterium GW2011_GWC2_39_41 TaxID=1618754 RepID=A0A837I0T9_9BACT|nr:MAG: hypothetical protein UT51_C0007G0019 [Candidatus Nomurabacteria bacterium GW2011_GWC2_39_41]KKR36468.1 MAG: hypothetical protein UT70_C0012G0010 [Candidatus Nomurabacteria bacterium GW2011_GWE2_40_10]KKR38214.1 MAG: hypothetical protein UT73_C0005G0031 [Candidatus Nomurabacteria bacterium GW2011_GWB1_40_11]KKR39947.1 MAG: hypothetical protein UT74_C0004G0030 [Parcubacteria group bacterium GW2011_GWC1_40_11]KKR65743.1 MAG: hypothetical protein UU07_C0025G0002 [Parcubacteria group bacteri
MLRFLGNKFLRGLASVDEPISGFFKLRKIRTGKNFGFRGIYTKKEFLREKIIYVKIPPWRKTKMTIRMERKKMGAD